MNNAQMTHRPTYELRTSGPHPCIVVGRVPEHWTPHEFACHLFALQLRLQLYLPHTRFRVSSARDETLNEGIVSVEVRRRSDAEVELAIAELERAVDEATRVH